MKLKYNELELELKSDKIISINDKVGDDYFIEFIPNGTDKKVIIRLSFITPDLNKSSSIIYLWKEKGYIKNIIENFMLVQTYIYDENDTCWGKCSPTIKPNTMEIDFDYLFEINQNNLDKVIDRFIELYYKGVNND